MIRKIIWLILLIPIFIILALFFLKASFTIDKIKTSKENGIHLLPISDTEIIKEPNRINILLLGIRGLTDPGTGKLLADTIMILSVKKDTKDIALISVPRDIYIKPKGFEKGEKINYFYALGEEKIGHGGGLKYMKSIVSQITGLYIDYAVSIDFYGFKKIVDELGGITINLSSPFRERFQWAKEGKEKSKHWILENFQVSTTTYVNGATTTATTTRQRWVFFLPKGRNTLNGQDALYYVRSRLSSNDFDRMKRQQQVISAIKDKVFSLNVLANPFKIFNLMDILKNHITTDMDLKDIKELIKLANTFKDSNNKIKKVVLDMSDNLLYHTFIDKMYVLLPKGGNFKKIQEVCQNVFK